MMPKFYERASLSEKQLLHVCIVFWVVLEIFRLPLLDRVIGRAAKVNSFDCHPWLVTISRVCYCVGYGNHLASLLDRSTIIIVSVLSQG